MMAIGNVEQRHARKFTFNELFGGPIRHRPGTVAHPVAGGKSISGGASAK